MKSVRSTSPRANTSKKPKPHLTNTFESETKASHAYLVVTCRNPTMVVVSMLVTGAPAGQRLISDTTPSIVGRSVKDATDTCQVPLQSTDEN